MIERKVLGDDRRGAAISRALVDETLATLQPGRDTNIRKTSSHRQPRKSDRLRRRAFCAALRQASRPVTRIYDAEFRETGLRFIQHTLLRLLGRVGEVRQGDLGELAALEESPPGSSLLFAAT